MWEDLVLNFSWATLSSKLLNPTTAFPFSAHLTVGSRLTAPSPCWAAQRPSLLLPRWAVSRSRIQVTSSIPSESHSLFLCVFQLCCWVLSHHSLLPGGWTQQFSNWPYCPQSLSTTNLLDRAILIKDDPCRVTPLTYVLQWICDCRVKLTSLAKT